MRHPCTCVALTASVAFSHHLSCPPKFQSSALVLAEFLAVSGAVETFQLLGQVGMVYYSLDTAWIPC